MDPQMSWESLWKYFSFERVQTREQLEAVLRIRYDVYCREFGFERPEDCPGQLEQDDYDVTAVHCLLRHNASGRPAGCVRVVLPGALAGKASDTLPMKRYCAGSLHDGPLHPDKLPRDQICEISRLAIPAGFRRRLGENLSTIANPKADVLLPLESRVFPLIGVSMFIAAATLVRLAERRHIYAMMEPRLARLLAKCGIRFVRIGELIDYHGERAPYYLDRLEAERNGRADLHTLYNVMLEQLSKQEQAPEPALMEMRQAGPA